MNAQSNIALAIFGVGIVGLVLCNLAVGYTFPSEWAERWRRRSNRRTHSPATQRRRRRVITGAPAAERMGTGDQPARQATFRADDLRRERQLLAVAESRRTVEELLEHDPERLARVVDQWLAQDRIDIADDPRHTN